ncbi:UDP-2,3-diacylglucosamine diphosphatase, partial [Pseudomonas frederiksbergensis]|nr:UDP-2,3-diacylglucosamine diphosphatase [Pseudomonas frederiksbergensis]
IRKVGEVDYLNCGDWVESCTALIEHWDGSIELYRLADAQAEAARRQAGLAALVDSGGGGGGLL